MTAIRSLAQLWIKRRDIARLIRLDRPYGTFLLMFPTLWSLVIASNGQPSIHHLIVFILGSFFMRSAGCVMNDMADDRFDAEVERTRNRPLPQKTITHREAFIVVFVLVAISFLLVLTLNRLTVALSFAALFFVGLYPFAKRFTHFAQVVLGITFSFGVLMAWTAVHGKLALVPFLILLANLFWTTGYDTIYALMDQEDDRKIGVKSTALFFGSKSRWAIGCCFALMLVFLLGVGQYVPMGRIYYTALGIATGVFLYQIWRLQTVLERDRLFSLFKAHAVLGGVILAGIILNFHWGHRD